MVGMARIRRAQERHDDSHPTVAPGVDGLLPASDGAGTLFLRDDGTWAAAGGESWISAAQPLWVRGTAAGGAHYLGGLALSYTGGTASGTPRSVSCLDIERYPRVARTATTASRTAAIYDASFEQFSTSYGFSARFAFGFQVWDSSSRAFVGLSTNTTHPTLTADVTAGTSVGMIGVCMDSGGTNWQWVHSATTTATSSSTGVAFTAGDVCFLTLESAGSQIDMTFEANGSTATTSVTSNFPDSITLGDAYTMGFVTRAYHVAGSGTTELALAQFDGVLGAGDLW